MRIICRAGISVGYIDPIILSRIVIAYQIKGTVGITGLYLLRVHIDRDVWYFDVGLSCPCNAEIIKGSVVRRLKRYMSWVQNVVKQFGFYPLTQRELQDFKFSMKRIIKVDPLFIDCLKFLIALSKSYINVNINIECI